MRINWNIAMYFYNLRGNHWKSEMIKAYMLLLLLINLAAIAYAEYKNLPTCGKGQHVYNHSAGYGCKECPPGTFMSYEAHTNIMCVTCQRADPYSQEIEAAPCTSTDDTVIKCVSGYYRKEMTDRIMHDGECSRCSVCKYNNDAPFEIKKCSDFDNTVCCPRDTDVAVKDEDGRYVCSRNATSMEGPQDQRLPQAPKGEVNTFIGCHPGEYMALNNQGTQQLPKCSQCPRGTFMDKEKHMETHCKECSADEGKILVRKCTLVSDAVFESVQSTHENFSRNEKNGENAKTRARVEEPRVILIMAALIIVMVINIIQL